MQVFSDRSALVLFSGGQDSSIALSWALSRYERVETIGFDYSQRHAVELTARENVRRRLQLHFPAWSERLGGDALIDLSGYGEMTDTALTREAAIVTGEDGLPSTFVPGRNLVFLSVAAAHAYQRKFGVLVAGMCEADSSGYPDCRKAALDAQMKAIELGMEAIFALETPLMHLSKAQSWFLAEELGGEALIELVVEESHSCYRGVRSERFDWGYGCGDCPACLLREKGWNAYIGAKSCRKHA